VRYGSVGGLEYEVLQSRLYCLCINVALLDGLAMYLSCDTKKFHDNESTHILHNFLTSTHRGGSFPLPPGGATAQPQCILVVSPASARSTNCLGAGAQLMSLLSVRRQQDAAGMMQCRSLEGAPRSSFAAVNNKHSTRRSTPEQRAKRLPRGMLPSSAALQVAPAAADTGRPAARRPSCCRAAFCPVPRPLP